MPFAILLLGVLGLLLATSAPAAEPADNARPRLIVLTDIRAHHEPDDAESLVRLLLYANELDIRGLVVNNSVYGKTVVRGNQGLRDIEEILAAYEKARPNLLRLDPAYPSADDLRAVSCSGQKDYGLAGVGKGKSSQGSNRILDEILEHPDDDRPLWLLGWGGVNTAAQALYDVAHNARPGKRYAKADLERVEKRLRVYDISGQDDSGAEIARRHPSIPYLRSTVQFRAICPRNDNVWLESRGGDERFVSRQWWERNIQRDHDPLGRKYPGGRYLNEGDSPSFLYLIPNGLSDPEHVDWGGWGGRFTAGREKNPGTGAHVRDTDRGDYTMHVPAADTWTGDEVLLNEPRRGEAGGVRTAKGRTYENNVYAPLFRFRPAFQNDFAARMDWAAGRSDANRRPIAVLNGDVTKRIVHVDAKPSQTVRLSADGSSDPDGDGLRFHWWVYPEAGTCTANVPIVNADATAASLSVPANAKGKVIHVILEVTDAHATTPLTAYRRLVIAVEP